MIKVYKINSNLAQYSDQEFSTLEDLLATEGVFDLNGTDTDFQVTENSPAGMSVVVNTGVALVEYLKDSTTWKVAARNNATQTLSVTANTSGYNRLDAVVLHLTQDEPNALKNNVAELRLVLGTGYTALSDSYINTSLGDTNWYRLADVVVPNGAMSIANADITDTRERVKVKALAEDGGTAYVTTAGGDQDIEDTKTFVEAYPQVVSGMYPPTINTQLVDKRYVDDELADIPSSGLVVGVAGEELVKGDAVSMLSYEIKYDTGMTTGSLNIGQLNANRKRSIKIIPKQDVTGATAINFLGQKVASAVQSLTITVETDNAGEPSGTAVADGTSSVISCSSWTTAYTVQTAVFANGFNLTKGVTYHIVFSVTHTDPSNYIQIGHANSYVNDFMSFYSNVYDIDTTSWGTEALANPPFFYFDNADLGTCYVKSVATNYGRLWSFDGFVTANAVAEADITVNTIYSSFPDALNPYTQEVSSDIDGYAYRVNANSVFSTLRTSAGTGYNSTNTTAQVYLDSGTTTDRWDRIDRGIVVFDTSVLPEYAEIVSATLKVYVDSKTTNFNQDLCIATRTDPVTIAAASYNIANWTMVRQATDIAVSSLVDSAYNVFTLNATGRASITTSAKTTFGLVFSCDIDGVAPTWQSNLQEEVIFQSAEGANPPILTVVYKTKLNNNTEYYITDIAGQVSSVGGTTKYKIGKAVSNEKLKVEKGIKCVQFTADVHSSSSPTTNYHFYFFKANRAEFFTRLSAAGVGPWIHGRWDTNNGQYCWGAVAYVGTVWTLGASPVIMYRYDGTYSNSASLSVGDKEATVAGQYTSSGSAIFTYIGWFYG